MKWTKYIVVAVLALVLMLGAVAAVLVATFDPNDYKDRIATAVKDQTGRDLTLSGEIGLSLFPWLGVRVADAALGNAPGFGDEPFARIGFAELHVTLMPLLRKELRVDRLTLRGLELNLMRAADGTGNWEDLTAPKDGAPKPTREPVKTGGVSVFDVAGIEIAAARLTWHDASTGESVVIAPVDASLGRLQPGAEVPVRIAARIVRERPAMAADVVLAANMKFDPSAQRLGLRGLTFDLDLVGEAIPGKGLQAKASADADIDLSRPAVRVERLILTLPGTRLAGSFDYAGDDKPAIRFTLEGDAIDLDRYLPPEAAQASGKPGVPSAGTSADTPIDLPVEALRALDLAGDLKFGRLTVKGVQLTDIRLTLGAQNGLVSLKPFSAGLYEGRLDTAATLDVRGREPRFTAEPRLEGVQIGEVMSELAGDRYLTGITRLEGRLETQGGSMLALRKGLNGRLAFETRDGTIKGMELARNINMAMGQINPGLALRDSGDETAFSTIRATATVTNGVVDNRDLHMLAPLFQALGKGTADLGAERVKYELAIANAPKPGETGAPKKTLPLLIEGPFDDLKYRLDLARVVEERAKEKVEEAIGKEKGKVEEKLQEGLRRLIR